MESLSGKRALVTGAAGFIGSNLVRRLSSEGVQVAALVRPGADLRRLQRMEDRIRILECDLLDQERTRQCVLQAAPEFVFNIASPGGHPADPEGQAVLLSNTLVATFSILEAAARAGVKKFLHAGSSLEYGAGREPHRETDILQPTTFRGVAKAASALLCQQFAGQGCFHAVLLRLFTIYGPWEQENRLVPTACRAALRNEFLPMTRAGFVHDWIHVDDVAEAFVKAAVRQGLPNGEVFNIGSGEQHTNEEVVMLIGGAAGRTIETGPGVYPTRAVDTHSWCADISKSRDLLSWQPSISLRSGLAATFAFWKTQETGHA